jgi:hypothetical protein
MADNLHLACLVLDELATREPEFTAQLIDLLAQVDLAELKKMVAASDHGLRASSEAIVLAEAPASQAAPTAAPSSHELRELVGIDWAFGSSEESFERTFIQFFLPRDASRAVKHLNRVPSSDPAARFVDAGKVLIRLLHDQWDNSILASEGALEIHWQYNEDGDAFLSSEYLEATFSYRGHHVRVVAIEPEVDRNPFVKLCARFESGRVIKGKMDRNTWQRIVDAVQVEAKHLPPIRPALPLPFPVDEGPWDERGHRIGGPRTPPRFLRPEVGGSGWAA